MIIKSFEVEKIKSNKKNLFLIYGSNQGHKNQVINELFGKLFEGEILRFDENDILIIDGVISLDIELLR